MINQKVKIVSCAIKQQYEYRHLAEAERTYISSFIGRVGTVVGYDKVADYPIMVKFEGKKYDCTVRFSESEFEVVEQE